VFSSGDAWAGSFGSNLDTSSSAVRVEKFGLRLDIDPELLLFCPSFIKITAVGTPPLQEQTWS
jgi:hypothetical protein